MAVKRRRVGRPLKGVPPGANRVPLGMSVRASVKAKIYAAAQASGRTQSNEVELLVEKALLCETLLEAMETTLDLIAKGRIEKAFKEAGYHRQGDADVWAREAQHDTSTAAA